MPETDMETVSSELVPTGLEEDSNDIENTEEQKKAVKRCSDWFTIDKDAKDSYVREMDENDKLRTNKHWDLFGPTGVPLRTESQQAMHPNSVENVAHTLVEGQVAEFAQGVEFVDFPEEDSDDEVAAKFSDIKQYLLYKNNAELQSMKWKRNYFWHGTGVWKHVWDPSWTGGVGPNRWLGEIRMQSRHPRLVFPDARCGEDIHQGRRITDARYVTKEYIEERFPEYASLVQDGVLDTTLLSAVDTETTVEAQLGQVLLAETWYIGTPLIPDKDSKRKGIGLHVIWWAGETNSVYLGHANYLNQVGKQPRLPYTFRARYPRDNSPWGYGEAYYIKQIQIMLNKTSDIIMEGHIHNVLGQTLFETEALSDKQKQHIQRTGTLAGMWNEVQKIDGVRRLYGSSVPASVQNEMNRLRGAMENVTGRYDVTLGRTPGSITAFKALALLDQRAQVRLRSAELDIRTAYEEMGMYVNDLIQQYYTERRAWRIIGTDRSGRFEVKKRGVFKLEDVQKAHFWEDGRVIPVTATDEEGLPVLRNFREGPEAPPDATPEELESGEYGDYEVFVPELDVKCRTSAALPSEKMFYMEMAKELLSAQAIDLEQFYMVLETGRFPPWSSIAQKVAEREQKMLEMQKAGAGGTMGSGGLPQGGRWTYTAQFKEPNAVQALNQALGGGQPGGLNPVLQQFIENLSPEDAQAIMEMAGSNPALIQELVNMDPTELQALLTPTEPQQPPRVWPEPPQGGAEGGQGQGQVSA